MAIRRFNNGIAVVAAVIVLCPRCVPVPGDQGGSIPPPDIDGGGTPPVFNPNGNDNGGDGAETTVTYSVRVTAHSLLVSGIIIDAVLTVTTDDGSIGGSRFTRATLRDTQNSVIGLTGVVGGLSLTASRGSSVGFDLTTTREGSATAVFRGSPRPDDPDRFVLPESSMPFIPGDTGVAYDVRGDSRFTFQINGDSVAGELSLDGVPISELGEADIYEGTFSGTRAR